MKTALIALGVGLLVSSVTVGTAGPFDEYVGGGVVVVRDAEQQGTVVDDGLVVCNKTDPQPSLGGGCVLFGPWEAILVTDNVVGTAVAFQVCIDNNGDSKCSGRGSEPGTGFCSDDLLFSHDDAGFFYNPLGPLPQGFRPGCPGGPWPGYVVFLCEGVHNTGTPHAHPAFGGSISGAPAGTGFGNFCQPQGGEEKDYVVR